MKRYFFGATKKYLERILRITHDFQSRPCALLNDGRLKRKMADGSGKASVTGPRARLSAFGHRNRKIWFERGRNAGTENETD